MIYEPNTVIWRKGDIVLHDADAKEPHMFMVVIGKTRDGLYKTQYVDKSHRRKIWKNELKYLHDVRRFGMEPNSTQANWQSVHNWNRKFSVGTAVMVTKDNGEVMHTKTVSKAFLAYSGDAVIWCDSVGGSYLLERVKPITIASEAI